uniref:Thioredoxin domain-containing protein n=1 Tax=Bos mutus grunniens TaxID=30521 RepID=A0A8C0A476_BOSMU
MVKQIESKYAFQEALNSAGEKLVVVDFSATWCGPCKMIKPFFHSLSEKYSNVVFLEVDVDDCQPGTNGTWKGLESPLPVLCHFIQLVTSNSVFISTPTAQVMRMQHRRKKARGRAWGFGPCRTVPGPGQMLSASVQNLWEVCVWSRPRCPYDSPSFRPGGILIITLKVSRP